MTKEENDSLAALKLQARLQDANLLQITAPHFCAGLIFDDWSVIEAAPIIGYMKSWNIPKVLNYVHRKGWGNDLLVGNGKVIG